MLTKESQENAEYQTTTYKSRHKGMKQRKDSTNTQTTESEASDLEHENIDKGTDVKNATELGLKLYTTQEKGWPLKYFTVEKLVTGLKNKTYKYTYENKNYTDEEVLQMIQAGDLKLKSCWSTIGIDQFREI